MFELVKIGLFSGIVCGKILKVCLHDIDRLLVNISHALESDLF